MEQASLNANQLGQERAWSFLSAGNLPTCTLENKEISVTETFIKLLRPNESRNYMNIRD